MNIYKTAVHNPITTILLFAAIGIMGLFSLSRLGIDLYPDIESNSGMLRSLGELLRWDDRRSQDECASQ